MERPRTGPMQFPGEIQPGVYLDRETVRMLFTADEAVALREIRQAFNGIQPVQQARLETEVIASVRAVKRVLASPDRGRAYQQALQAARDALKLAQEFKRAKDQLLDNIAHLLNQISDRGTCKGCGNTIYWVQHLNGKRTPYTREGGNHFIDCVAAKDFKKGKV